MHEDPSHAAAKIQNGCSGDLECNTINIGFWEDESWLSGPLAAGVFRASFLL